MSLFRDLGKKAERIKRQVTADENEVRECVDCGAELTAEREECPDCGSDARPVQTN